MFSIWICLELVVYFLVLVFLNNISLTFVSKKNNNNNNNKTLSIVISLFWRHLFLKTNG